ncbi:unnamed protein product [Trichobilharzia szidati]|nr:unnamed protein product [Trichobilharzia szidati]
MLQVIYIPVFKLSCQVENHYMKTYPSMVSQGRKEVCAKLYSRTQVINSCHSTNPEHDFKIIYQIHGNLPRFLCYRLLKTAEALAIHDIKPDLYVPKEVCTIPTSALTVEGYTFIYLFCLFGYSMYLSLISTIIIIPIFTLNCLRLSHLSF